MKRLDKYLFGEYLAPLAYCLAAFVLLYVVCDLFAHMSLFLNANVPLGLLVRYYLALVATTLEFIVPASLLLATLYALWNLARHNEVTAMRASGLSFVRILVPFFVVGLAVTVVVACVKEMAAPAAAEWVAGLSASRFRGTGRTIRANVVSYNRETRRTWLIGWLDAAEPHKLFGVTVKQERPDHTKAQEFVVEKAEWLGGRWRFHNATVQDFQPDGRSPGPPRALPPVVEMRDLTEEPTRFVLEGKPAEFLSSRQILQYLAAHPELSPESLARWRTDLHSRLALPWSCLIVALFGAPMGARGGRQSAFVGILVALSLFLAFYGLTQVGLFLGQTAWAPPWLGAWLPNILFLTAAIVMIWKVR
jgi:lipopolysaccharide export system permease protein